MTPDQEEISRDPIGYFLLMVTVFPGIACPISLVIVEDTTLRGIIAGGGGLVLTGIMTVLYYRGKRGKKGTLRPARIGFLWLSILFVSLGVLASLLALLAWRSANVHAGISLPLGSLGFLALALFCFRRYKEKNGPNLEGCVRPERSGTGNTTDAEPAPASPTASQGRLRFTRRTGDEAPAVKSQLSA